jgi:hypothetical protein
MWGRLAISTAICTLLLASLFLARHGLRGSAEGTADVKGVNFQDGTITLAGGKGCGSTQPPTVRFNSNTQFSDLRGHGVKPSELGHATRISFECLEEGKEGLAKKIILNGTSENVKRVDFKTGTITLAHGKGCGSTSPPMVQFDSNTQFLDLNGSKVDSPKLERATSISFECAKEGPVKKITINGTSEGVKCVNFQTGTITLASGKGCGSTSPPTVKFDFKTQFVGLNGWKPESYDLVRATSISFECAERGPAKKITIKGMSEDVKCVHHDDDDTGTITLAGGQGCGSTSPPTVKFDSKTQFVDLNGRKLESYDLKPGTSISFEYTKDGRVKKITIKGMPEDVKCIDFQTRTITLDGGQGCGSTSPPTVKFDSKTQFVNLNGRKLESSYLVRATSISFECVEKDPVKKIAIIEASDKDDPSFSLGQVLDSVVANTEQDRFSDVEGDIVYEEGVLKWKLDQRFQFGTNSCWVLAAEGSPNYFQCNCENPPGCQVTELFKKVQQTMSTFRCFHLDERRSGQSVRTYTDQANRVRVSVTVGVPSKGNRGRVDVKACTLTVEVIPAPH